MLGVERHSTQPTELLGERRRRRTCVGRGIERCLDEPAELGRKPGDREGGEAGQLAAREAKEDRDRARLVLAELPRGVPPDA